MEFNPDDVCSGVKIGLMKLSRKHPRSSRRSVTTQSL
jgi:hypothetical protein